ncbi:hypothetical protein TNCV_4786951 [Trichonephila clavipes]|nr:hypothetical protein TNCV_4786951 [Trichonephila clavipes]
MIQEEFLVENAMSPLQRLKSIYEEVKVEFVFIILRRTLQLISDCLPDLGSSFKEKSPKKNFTSRFWYVRIVTASSPNM